MKTIWKFPIEITDDQKIQVPHGALFLHAQMQFGELCLWAAVESESPLTVRTIEVFGTGNPIPDGTRNHIGTVFMTGGALVWHVFERLS